MAHARTIIIAGAGIGGLTAALALARAGFRVVVLEAAPQLEEIGAGIQLSPNATYVLRSLGLDAALKPHVTAPKALRVMNARSGTEIVSMPLGPEVAARDTAPYWLIHRGDLQRVLLDAVEATPEIVLRLGVTVAGHRGDGQGVTVAGRAGAIMLEERGVALIGADGLWSAVRKSLGHDLTPGFRHRTAWRATVPTQAIAAEWRQPITHLWLGPEAHLVHYPVRAGAALNIVAIVRDRTSTQGWNAPGSRDHLLARVARWAPGARKILEIPQVWHTWSLYDLPPLPQWGAGPVTLLGDAAHPLLPFLAQGGALAIEDAWVLADELAKAPEPAAGFRAYERRRQPRAARVTRAAARAGLIYHCGGPFAVARNLAMRTIGGNRLLRRYDWLYDWKGG